MNRKIFFSLLIGLLTTLSAAAQLYDDPRLLSFEKSSDIKAWQADNATVKWCIIRTAPTPWNGRSNPMRRSR